nr:bifunctional oligoribonuclease/PAP phosphatase NrnA [uncultured Anaeromusa sp.]
MKRLTLQETAQRLLASQNPVLTAHVHPDGDSLGSLLGLAELLEALGKRAQIWLDDEVPPAYRFLPGWERIQRLPEHSVSLTGDLLVVLDASDKGRIGRVGECLEAPLLNIDHHVSNMEYADELYLDVKAAATGEIITQLAEEFQCFLSAAAADALYVAIATDCGFFRYANTTPQTLRMAALLVEAGARPAELSEALESRPYAEVVALREVLDTLEVTAAGRVAYITVTPEVAARIDSTEGFINYPRTLEGVEVAVLFKFQDDQHARVSLRSKGADVSQVALSFGGGGHTRAAGCSVEGDSPEEMRRKVLSEVKKILGTDGM